MAKINLLGAIDVQGLEIVAHAEKPLLRNLGILADFLNFQFDDGADMWDRLKTANFGLFTWINGEFRESPKLWKGSWKDGALEEVRLSKAQLLYDVEGLLSPQHKLEALGVIIETANRMLKPSWYVSDEHGGVVKRAVPCDSFQQFLYGTLAMALEDDGELFKLKKCQHCQRFFIAEKFVERATFCSKGCRRDHHDGNGKAVQRAKASKDFARKKFKRDALKILSNYKSDDESDKKIEKVLGERKDDFFSMYEAIKAGYPKEKVWTRASNWKKASLKKLIDAGL